MNAIPEIPLEHFRALLDEAPVGIAVCREDDGEYVFVNKAFAQILGLTVEETLRRSYWEITPKKYESQEAQQLERLEQEGRYGPYEKEYIHRTKKLVPVRLSCHVIEIEGTAYI